VVTIAGGTETGRRYQANFDVLYTRPDPPLAVVADGMGDSPAAAVASRTAVEVFVALAAPDPAALRTAVALAHREVAAAGSRVPGLAGCTLGAIVPTGLGDAWLVQIGDCRIYRHRAGLLELLTVDHTEAWYGALYGWYPPGSPQATTDRYRLHRFVGHPGTPEPDILNVALHRGDVLCLCSDGLAEQVPYHRLASVLGSGTRPEDQVATLLADTLAAGGHDNATMALVRVD
jgi:PPM family protein phosphatase